MCNGQPLVSGCILRSGTSLVSVLAPGERSGSGERRDIVCTGKILVSGYRV